ncbi:MAG: glycosyltransferase [Candidatus Rokubacteria bacterium]|nr:glycosyltransferase [Candidatus Rokubacteria bacterium]
MRHLEPVWASVCALCGSPRVEYAFAPRGLRLAQCQDCRLLFRNPQPSDHDLAKIYSGHYFLHGDGPDDRAEVSRLKRATADMYLDAIARYRGTTGGRLLEIGCGEGDFLAAARARGLDVVGVEPAEAAALAAGRLAGDERIHRDLAEVDARAPFDVVVLADVLEHVRDPLDLLRVVRERLAPDGTLFLAVPSLDSWSRWLLGPRWMEFKDEHLYYFDRNTVESALFKAGFGGVVTRRGRKVLSLEYVARHFRRFPVAGLTPLVGLVDRGLPRRWRRRPMAVNPGGIVVLARPRPVSARPRVSIIVPVFNERATVRAALDAVLAADVAGCEREVIVVESNSTDGSRDEVLAYARTPGVSVVLEDRPRGKGHAVREGFARASGDFILIQDADLEYDVGDYPALLRPLVSGSHAFVLGSRHLRGGALKMRRFTGQPALALVLNCGHWFFATLINVLFRQSLKDPFTMFKVFRRECLHGLAFECDRFDFDCELVVKLLRKGYRPLEVPVNYVSRSFAEGKKVSVLRDPPTWIRAIVKYRFARVERD